MTTYRIGIDIGGTFTDFALIGGGLDGPVFYKELTTPHNPARAVLEGMPNLLERAGIGVGDVDHIVHGTTLVTNSVIERRGARTGMLVTKGFADILDIGREQRYDLYDLRIRFAEPLAAKADRIEISERVLHDGSVECPLDPDEAAAAARRLVESGIGSLAICFLHSYKAPEHERAARKAVQQACPGLPVSISSDVFPYMREFERWTTTVVNAYSQPIFASYLSEIERGLADLGFAGRLDLMSSSGGILTPELARRLPVRMLESGPAAGVLMAAHFGRAAQVERLLAFDLGGTTAKGALVSDGEPLKAYEMEVATTYKYRRGSGLPLRLPVLDMTEIGSGGGSIAAIDQRGLIAVGPQSASADPGPACYGCGGVRPTLTDANLLLGILDPEFFLGGRMHLEPEAARQAIAAEIGDPLGLDADAAAWGIHDIVNEDIARAFRLHAAERGVDFRRAAMVASGGGGPIHATGVARKLEIARVIVPMGAGAMSALGLLSAPPAFEVARSQPVALDGLDCETFVRIIGEMAAEVRTELSAAGVSEEEVQLRAWLDLRFVGQGYEIECPLPAIGSDDEVIAAHGRLREIFLERYRELFGNVTLDEPAEVIAWKLEGRGARPTLSMAASGSDGCAEAAIKAHRSCWVPERTAYEPVPVYDRYALPAGAKVIGPALIQERESTCLLRVGDLAVVDPALGLVLEISPRHTAPNSQTTTETCHDELSLG
ncbi:hydantoinase/oxoprolinase family protein [Rhodobacteraceae bacterium NNCM2]|nr:hydantoinase/oxoprolinase family protein [Coraliihabitans acroporae]